MMNLQDVVERYASLGKWGEPAALSAFGLSPEETARLFSALDEDYHTSRFLHFSRSQGQSYAVSGEAVTHVAMDEAISSVL